MQVPPCPARTGDSHAAQGARSRQPTGKSIPRTFHAKSRTAPGRQPAPRFPEQGKRGDRTSFFKHRETPRCYHDEGYINSQKDRLDRAKHAVSTQQIINEG